MEYIEVQMESGIAAGSTTVVAPNGSGQVSDTWEKDSDDNRAIDNW
ncbi:TPA: hypothetical protein NEG48_003729 [Elizabethkingia anophelis]|nr:hypothetical protein [Elizabethkingia anophelis]